VLALTTLVYGLPLIGVPPSVIAIASLPTLVGVYVAVYVPVVLSVAVNCATVFAPDTVTRTVDPPVVRLLPKASLACTVIVVSSPADPPAPWRSSAPPTPPPG